MKRDLKLRVDRESTLLPFLLESISGKSRNYLKGALKRGQITIDGKICTDYSRELLPGQIIELNMEAPKAESKLAIPLIYEDNQLIVVNKPAGMLTIATDKENEKTAYRIVNDHMKSLKQPGRIFIVHRLDRETSGVLLFAKDERTKLVLQDNWDEMVIKRGYIAVVEGCVSDEAGRVRSWLKQTQTLMVYSSQKEGDGKLAITNYRVLKTQKDYSMLEIALETGRKNQIRVHMKDIGHPIAGDKKYGAKTNPFKRLALHSEELIIKHPVTGEQLALKSKAPDVFNSVFK